VATVEAAKDALSGIERTREAEAIFAGKVIQRDSLDLLENEPAPARRESGITAPNSARWVDGNLSYFGEDGHLSLYRIGWEQKELGVEREFDDLLHLHT
jgi:hypothetical protein